MPVQIGLEVEAGNISRDSLSALLQQYVDPDLRYQLHDDGSIRTENWEIGGGAIIPITVGRNSYYPVGARTVDRFGPEIVSDPLNREDARRFAIQVSEALFKHPINPRGSIHVHVSGFDNWQHVQNLCAWVYALEAPLFRVSGLGKPHRGGQMYQGRSNDYLYCRPLSAPIHIHHHNSDSRTVPIINTPNLLNAETFGQFLAAWGRLDLFWRNDSSLHHYCPHRQHIINIASLLRHGTVEFRLWNGVYEHVPTALDVSLRIFDMARVGPPAAGVHYRLGADHDMTPMEFSRMIDLDVFHVWGKHWPPGVLNPNLFTHYSNHLRAYEPTVEVLDCIF